MQFKVNQISLLVSALFFAGSAAVHADDATSTTGKTTDVGAITVQGEPGGTDTGLIQQEETPKARSSVNRAYIEKQGGTTNPYQLVSLLPGVSTADYDGTGLFGGTMRVRGFNSDELGFTIDGVPVNDSGSFAVYPQEYVEPENMCEIFVTQGSTDTDAPHIGASGGNIGIVTCDPQDKQRFRIVQEIGSHSLWKSYLRFDSGKFLNDDAKFFVSYSEANANKFRGDGHAQKEHIDIKGRLELGGGSYLDAGYLWNKQLNNNYLAVTKAQLAQYGWDYDYGVVAPQHQPLVKGGGENDPAYGPNANITTGQNQGYYGLALNPFIDSIATLQSHFQLAPNASLDVEPYFWYGYGTGGNQLQTITLGTSPANCGNPALKQPSCYFGGGIPTVGGDSTAKDKIYVYEGSVTKTNRPGVTSKFNYQFDNQHLMLGYWYEHAHHEQTGPYEQIDGNGNPVNAWLNDPNQWVQTANGQPLEYRDTMTITTAHSAFVQDNISLLQDKLNVQLGVRDVGVDRNFHNYASLGSGTASYIGSSGADYSLDENYRKTLPSLGLRYQFTDASSAFFNVTENFRAPGNYDYFNLLVPTATAPNGQLYYGPNGQLLPGTYTQRPVPVQPETSWDYDLGYRYASERWTFSGTMFYIDFQNRIASAYIDALQTSVDQNVGDVHQYGVEFESGYKLAKDWSLYSSLSYMKTSMQQNLDVGSLTKGGPDAYLPTAGKELPDTPKLLAGVNLSYTHDKWDGFVEAKYTDKRYTSLVNDDAISGYTLVNAGGGYKFDPAAFLKTPTIRFNILNLFGSHYLSMTGPSGSSYSNNAYAVATPNGVIAPGKALVNGVPTASTFYIGAPRSYTITFSSDF